MLSSSILTIGRTLSGATNPGQSGPGSDGNEGDTPHSPKLQITEASLTDCLTSIQETRWGKVLLLCRDAVGVFYSPSWVG